MITGSRWLNHPHMAVITELNFGEIIHLYAILKVKKNAESVQLFNPVVLLHHTLPHKD